MTNEKVAEGLANEICSYINIRRDKKEEDFLKTKPKKNKQGVITNGAINNRLIAILKGIGSISDTVIKIDKSKKDKVQTALDFQRERYEALQSLTTGEIVDEAIITLRQEYQEFVIKNNTEHDAVTWLNTWCEKAKDISFATHVGKLTHSSSKSSSILDTSSEVRVGYLTTNSLIDIKIDTASSNAASLPVADILKLSVNDISILDCLKSGNKSVFNYITDNKGLVEKWSDQLKQAYDSRQKQSYFLSKQIYFPTSENDYHLLLPLTSSSLVHAVHLEHKKYFEDSERLEAREQKNKLKYSAFEFRTYPNKAYIHVTGSNHSNASSLNGKRGGRIALMAAMPPQWQSKPISYINSHSIFEKALAYELKQPITELRNYLQLIKNKALSISEPKRNAAVKSKLQAISDQLFDHLGLVNQSEKEGWTINSQLLIEQQLMFEPWREDETARLVKNNKQWQKKLSQDYGRWLNGQLNKNKKLNPTAVHAGLWADCFALELREIVATQEVTI